MKTKGPAIILTLVLLLSCCPLWVAAEPETSDPAPVAAETVGFAALSFLDYEGCTTVITDLRGAEHSYPGCLDVTSLEEQPCCEEIASYRIQLDGETLLEVTLHDIVSEGGVSLQESKPMSNGYYAVQFDLDEKQEVFLTGLTPENLAEVQEELLAAGLTGQDISLADIDFIDAEKAENLFNLENRPDTDSVLCWAAATSNILYYTGWGQQAGFGSTDYLFDVFTTRFEDIGGDEGYGLDWFFNGYYLPQKFEGWPHVDDGTYGIFHGYLPDYPSETVKESYSLENHRETLSEIAACLREGRGASLGIYYYKAASGEQDGGGHAITLWGYVRAKDDADGFSYLVISDSDDDKYDRHGDRRSAPNRLLALGLTVCTLWDQESWAFSDYDLKGNESIVIVLGDATTLVPYSEDLPKETEGTRNRFIDPDLTVTKLGVDTLPDSQIYDRMVLPAGQELFVPFKVESCSEVTAGSFTYQIRVERNGVPPKTFNGQYDDTLEPGYHCWGSVCVGTLDAGRYTVTMTVNPEKTVTEANYLNDTKTVSFTVAEASPVGTLEVSLGDMGIQDNGSVGATAALTCPEVDGRTYSLYTAYGDDAADTDWTLQYKGSVFPTRLFTERDVYYSNVFYRLLINTGDPARPWLEYLSGPVAQRYLYIWPYDAEGNTGELTAMPQGSMSCAEGERTCFRFFNGSEVPGSLAFDWGLWAKEENGSESYCLKKGSGTLEQGQSSDPITNASLAVLDPKTGEETGQTLPVGSYILYAEAYYKNLTKQDETYSARVGSITITPTGDLPRLTTGDASGVMQTRATFSASACVEPGTKARLGIECSTDEDFDCAALFWFTEDYRDSQTLSETREFRPLLPAAKYYYRAVLEVQEGDGVKVYRDENVKSLETNRPDGLKELTAEQPADFTPVKDDWSYYVFKAPESGWYNVSVSCAGGFALDYFVEGDNAWYAEKTGGYLYGRDGKAAFNCYIPAGRQMCATIWYFVEAPCTITFSEVPVTDYSAYEPTLTQDGAYSYAADLSAAVPLGSSFTLGLEYGTDKNSLKTASEDFSDWTETGAEATVVMDCLPGRTYYYRAFVKDADTGDTVYSDFQTAEVPPFSGALLQEGAKTLTLARNETRSYYSFTAETAGTYTLWIDGPDGVFTYWDEGWTSKQFSLNGTYDGTAVTGSLAAGETAYFTVKAYSPGEYHLSYSFAAASPSNSGSGGGGAAPAVNPVTVPSASSAAAAHGSVTASAANAKAGDTVILTPEPEEGYVTAGVTVTDAKGNNVPVTKNLDGTYSFIMPDTAVTVTPEFVALPAPNPAPTGDVSDRFTDVSKTAWYHDAVQWAVDKGLMNGVSDTLFAPDGTCTRAMVVTMLWRLTGEPVVNYALPYTDVPEDTWYTEAVRWAASARAVNGTSETTFDPNAPVTREQLAAILYRYAQAQGKGFTGSWMFLLDYPDAAEVSEYANEAMHWMTMLGIITGMGDGTLAPKDNATRAQIATMFMRFCAEMEA